MKDWPPSTTLTTRPSVTPVVWAIASAFDFASANASSSALLYRAFWFEIENVGP
jgi:hypothetical protein